MFLLLFACNPFTMSDEAPEPGRAPIVLSQPRPVSVGRVRLNADSSLPKAEAALTSDQCATLTDGGPVGGPDCATAEIRCGETVIGHTRGGVQRYDSQFYAKHYCTPATTKHDDGHERIYRLELPPGETRAFVDLETPCADLDLAAILLDGTTCPGPGDSSDCEMSVKKGTTGDRVELVGQEHHVWWIVVEGKGEEEGAFALHVQCREGVR